MHAWQSVYMIRYEWCHVHTLQEEVEMDLKEESATNLTVWPPEEKRRDGMTNI